LGTEEAVEDEVVAEDEVAEDEDVAVVEEEEVHDCLESSTW
jgi:hypothetical protein